VQSLNHGADPSIAALSPCLQPASDHSRCFYVAQSYFGAAKFAEAYVLYKRAAEQAQLAVAEYKKVKHPSGVSSFLNEKLVV
jgi:hypothetical protein